MSKEIKPGEVVEEAKAQAAGGLGGEDVAAVKLKHADAIVARMADVHQSGVNVIKAESVHMEQSGARTVKAETVYVEQGGIGLAQGETVGLTQGGIGLAQASTVALKDGRAGAVIAGSADVQHASIVLLAARKVSGEDVEVLFDVKAAVVFGLVTGLVLGLIRLLVGRKKT